METDRFVVVKDGHHTRGIKSGALLITMHIVFLVRWTVPLCSRLDVLDSCSQKGGVVGGVKIDTHCCYYTLCRWVNYFSQGGQTPKPRQIQPSVTEISAATHREL